MNYRKFKIEQKFYKSLSAKDRTVLKILEDVVRDIGPLYDQQIKDGFYPKGTTKPQIFARLKKNPQVFSPFTYIEEKNGQWEAIPYHKKYAKYLVPITEKIKKAAKISTNASFKKYLLARAESLLDGNYRRADIAWFDVKNSKIDFAIGPFERYLDNLLLRKRIFQAHVGIIDEEKTIEAKEIKKTLYLSARMSFEKHHSSDIPQKGVNIFVEQLTASAGYMADVVFSGEHFPIDLAILKQYGSKVLIYYPQIKLKFEKLHYPIFKTIFEKKFAAKYSKELLLQATVWNIMLYELSRQLHKFLGARKRLQELYGPVDEANGPISGIQHAKYLVVKGLISQDELEAIIIIHIVRMFSDWLTYQKTAGLRNHMLGDAIALNTYLKSGAIREIGGISWPNFSRIFFEIDHLAEKLVCLLQEGSYKEVEQFIKQNTSLTNFVRLSKNLAKLELNL